MLGRPYCAFQKKEDIAGRTGGWGYLTPYYSLIIRTEIKSFKLVNAVFNAFGIINLNINTIYATHLL